MSVNQIPPKDIQGDILDRLPKDCEHFLLFSIKDAAKFRESLRGLLAPDKGIGSAADVKDVRNKFSTWNKANGRMEHSFYNIGFSKDGIDLLGLKHEDLNDEHFNKGQLEDAKILGDPMVRKSGQELPDWEDEFLKVALNEQHPIHGIILVAGNEKNVKEHSAEIRKALEEQGAASIVYFLEGAVLPGERRKNEHFGWRDGISQPFVEGYTTDKHQTGQTKIPPGVLIVGAKGDLRASSRPEWARGGSFMVFRKLQQFVPEFKQFLVDAAIKEGVIGHENQANAAKLLGSRLFGRWPSGTPLEKQPAEDRGVPEDELNSFDYKNVKSPNCPFAAHIRKTNPRNGLPGNSTVNSSIVRAGIPYGEEWANNPEFPPTPSHEIVPGFDGIIGQNNKPGDARARNGIDGLEISKDFVHPRAGCYFFVPSIPALHEHFSG
ncbi:hypothetical protein RHS03_06802, partial [Rhizoctonia solani]